MTWTLPIFRSTRLSASSAPEANNALLRLPSDPRYLNHLGSVHASALLALAEASSGEFLLRHFGSSEGIVPVVRRLESKFRKPANGSVTSTASATPEALARLTSDLASKGRSIILVAVELHDESGYTCALCDSGMVHSTPSRE